MVVVVVLIFMMIFGIKIINKTRELSIDTILKKGTLKDKIGLKGDIFYKSTAKKKDGVLSYLTYIRLENGKELTLDNFDFYSSLNIGEVINFTKEIYIYKNQILTFYSTSLDGVESLRFCEELDLVN